MFDDFDAGQQIADELIKKFHVELSNVKFRFLCRNKASKSGEKKKFGQIKKASPMERHICGGDTDFIVIIALDVWNEYSSNQRNACIDHFLSKIIVSEDEITAEPKYKLASSGVNESPEVIDRFGAWNEELQDLSNAFKQSK